MKGHGTVPSQANVETFYSSVLDTEAEGGLIGVHCTHGLNRTGYLISRYLIEKQGWDPDRAIAAFDLARGHKQERENYLDHLKHKRWETSTGAAGTREGQFEEETPLPRLLGVVAELDVFQQLDGALEPAGCQLVLALKHISIT